MRRQLFILVGLLFGPVLAVSWSGYGRVAEAQPVASLDTESVPSTAQVEQALQSSPLMFIENVGQFAEDARFQVRGGNRTIWLAEDAIWVTILEPAATEARPDHKGDFRLEAGMEGSSRQGVNIRLSFVGANPATTIEPFAPLETSISYFIGNDPAGWRSDVPVWGGVRYVDLYPGLDLELSGSQAIRPRLVCRVADCATALADVALQVEGAEGLVAEEASLSMTTPVGSFSLPWLEVIDAAGRPVGIGEVAPAVTGDLVQRPYTFIPTVQPAGNSPTGSSLLYSAFLGGEGADYGFEIAVDGAGNAFVTGYTESTNFPTTPGAFDTTYNGFKDAFVTKLNTAGSGLLYSTFLGGESVEEGYDIAVDGTGSAFVTGHTGSTNFPTTPGAFDTTHNGSNDAFVIKLNAAGSSLLYSTFLGGEGLDFGHGIAVDGAGNASVTGSTSSTIFPTTPGAFDTTYNGGDWFMGDAFVTKFNVTGSGLLYSTFLGSGNQDVGYGIAVDGVGSTFVTGLTLSTGFPTTPGAFDTTHNGINDAFVTRLNVAGSSLLYSTFLGGGYRDEGWDITVGGASNAFITGLTESTDFPTTPGAFDTTYNGSTDAFVTKLNATGSSLLYSTFLGGGGGIGDYGHGIAVDGAGNAIVTGGTPSLNFPITPGAYDTTYNGGDQDAFVTKLNAAGSGLLYSTFLGGGGRDYSPGIAVDGAGNAFVTGNTGSPDFPTTPGAFNIIFGGLEDAFVTKLNAAGSNLLYSTFLGAGSGIDLGFRPNTDGYGFENWAGGSEITVQHLVDMFGEEAVCRFTLFSLCWPKQSAQEWRGKINGWMQGGHCFGMTHTAQRFFLGNDSPGDFGSDVPFYLPFSIPVREHIAFYFALQDTDPVNDQIYGDLENTTPNDVLNELQTTLTAGNPPGINIWNPLGSGGHSVLPYLIVNLGGSIYRVFVYDNNSPGDLSRWIEFDTNDNKWHSNLAGSVGGWYGDAYSHNIGLLPVAWLDTAAHPPQCPWCDSSTESGGSSRLNLFAGGPARLLITDALGRELGFSETGGGLINEMPGADYLVPLTGIEFLPPNFYLPVTQTYTIGLHADAAGSTDLVQFGPGYAIGANNVAVTATTADQLAISNDGTQIVYQSSAEKEIDLFIAYDGVDESYQFTVIGSDLATNDIVELGADIAGKVLTLSHAQGSAGVYDLELSYADASGNVVTFISYDVPIDAQATQFIEFSSVLDDETITVCTDLGSDGTVDECETRENELGGSVYLPIMTDMP